LVSGICSPLADLCRRSCPGALLLPRFVQSLARAIHDKHGFVAHGPSVPRFMGNLRAGQRVAGPPKSRADATTCEIGSPLAASSVKGTRELFSAIVFVRGTRHRSADCISPHSPDFARKGAVQF